MSLLDQLRSELAALSPDERAQFLGNIEPDAPAAPPTALDELRASTDYADLEVAVSEIPAVHELPVLVAVLTKRVFDLEHANEDDEPVKSVSAPLEPSDPGSSVESPAAPSSPPAPPAPSTPNTPDAPPPPAAAVQAAPNVSPEQAATQIPVPPSE